MKFERVRTFVTITDAGSFMAACQFGLAQLAISKQMAKLERELGTRLFLREASGERLTTAGEAFLVEARRIVELNHSAVARA